MDDYLRTIYTQAGMQHEADAWNLNGEPVLTAADGWSPNDNLAGAVLATDLQKIIARMVAKLLDLGFVQDVGARCTYNNITIKFHSIIMENYSATIVIFTNIIRVLVRSSAYYVINDMGSADLSKKYFMNNEHDYVTILEVSKKAVCEIVAAVNELLPQPIAEEIAPQVYFGYV